MNIRPIFDKMSSNSTFVNIFFD